MKRLTVAMSDNLYKEIVEYAADQSKRNVRRLSLGEAMRNLASARLRELGYTGVLTTATIEASH